MQGVAVSPLSILCIIIINTHGHFAISAIDHASLNTLYNNYKIQVHLHNTSFFSLYCLSLFQQPVTSDVIDFNNYFLKAMFQFMDLALAEKRLKVNTLMVYTFQLVD